MMNDSPDSLSTLQAQLQDIDKLWNPIDPAASEASLQALLPQIQALSGRERYYQIEVLTLIARAQCLQQKLADAQVSLGEAERLLSEEGAGYPVAAQIRWMIEKGRIHIVLKTPSQARQLFADAWTLALNSGEDFFAVDIAQMMAAIEPLKVQQQWIEKAIKLAEDSPQEKPKRWLGSLYSTLGWKNYDARKYEEALEIFQRALRHLKVHGTAREAFVAKWSIGKILRIMSRTEEALVIQRALLNELGIGGHRDGRLYEEVAECLYTLKRADEAQLYFELAYRELSNDQWTSDNHPVRLKRLKDLGKVKGGDHKREDHQ